MIAKVKIQTKVLFPLSVLILIVMILTSYLLYIQYSKGKSLVELKKSIELATSISRLVHETQKERGLTSGFLASNGVQFKKELLKQRILSDIKIKQVRNYLLLIHNDDILNSLRTTLLNIDKLILFRKKVDSFAVGVQSSINFYSKVNDDFLNVIVEVSKISQLPLITKNIVAYSNFLFAKENAGLERAVGTALLTQKQRAKVLEVRFSELITIEKLYIKTFLKYASIEANVFYHKTYQGKCIDEVEKIKKVILFTNDGDKYGINSQYWFYHVTKRIDKLKLIDSFLEKEILNNIKTELNETYKRFSGFILLNIISIAIFFIMIILLVKLIKSKERLKKIIDKYIISSTTDLKGRITDVSDAFCEISGYTRKELIGKPHSVIRHPDVPARVFRELWTTIQKGEPWRGEVKNLKKDGGYYWVYANVEPLISRKGKIEGYAAIRLDITDSVHLEEELIRSKQKDKTLLHQSKLAQMGEMISMIAHQWRQPLTAISSTSSDLYMKIMLDNYEKDYFSEKLEKIDDLSQHLSNTIDDFRTFYKEDKEKEVVLYSNIARSAFEIISTSLTYKNIELKSDFQCQKYVYVLANELRQVILNLIKNAEDVLIEKEIKDPYIRVQTYDDNEFSYLRVSDNGGGISEDIIDDIFDPYFSTKIKKDGTGLGLYMSKVIIEEHCRGYLLVENTNEGASFIIKIPIYQENENV